jgi:hypothetical protein
MHSRSSRESATPDKGPRCNFFREPARFTEKASRSTECEREAFAIGLPDTPRSFPAKGKISSLARLQNRAVHILSSPSD